MTSFTALISLLALLALPFASAQGVDTPDSWTINASTPLSNPTTSGCAILAQLSSTEPLTLQALLPLCPAGTPAASDPPTGITIPWPIVAIEGVDASKLKLAIYGDIAHKADRTDIYMAQAGCVMELSAEQIGYLYGRSLTWNNNLQELWDNTGNGFVMQGMTGDAKTCGPSAALLPPALYFPDPYVAGVDDPSWKTAIALTVRGPKPITNGTVNIPTNITTGGGVNVTASSSLSSWADRSSSAPTSTSISNSSSAVASSSSSPGPLDNPVLIEVTSSSVQECALPTVTVTVTAETQWRRKNRYEPRATSRVHQVPGW